VATFISGTRLADRSSSASGTTVVSLDLVTGLAAPLAQMSGVELLSGTAAVSPDRASVTYLEASPARMLAWHLVRNGQDRVLGMMGPMPSRDADPEADSVMLAFSPDGQEVALVQTFAGLGDNESGQFQVRRLDGSIVAAYPSTTALAPAAAVLAESRRIRTAAPGPDPKARTMAVWGGKGASLYYADATGVHVLTADAHIADVLPGVRWIDPHASQDGATIAYYTREGQKPGTLSVLDVGTGKTRVLAQARISPVFVAPGWLEDKGDAGCSQEGTPCGPSATAPAYLEDLSTGAELPSPLGVVVDTWPDPGGTH
jgi:hypothetical protein